MINLQENMDKQGIRTTQKGVCCVCEKPIVGQVVTALGKNHYFAFEKKLHILIIKLLPNPPKLHILDRLYNSDLGKTFHSEHFTCHHCNQELGTRNFFERDGVPYCEADYHLLFSPRYKLVRRIP